MDQYIKYRMIENDDIWSYLLYYARLGVPAIVLADLLQVFVEGVGGQLADVGGGGEQGGVYKVNPPTPGKEILLFA